MMETTTSLTRDDLIPLRTFALETLGCKVNRVESDSLQALLVARGFSLAAVPDAHCIIVNTCTVTAEADKKSRKAVRNLLRKAPQARIIVTGCAAALKPTMFTSLDERVQVVDRMQLLSLLHEKDALERVNSLRIGDGFRTRVGVKIQDGCDNACTYCIVHVARGPARSIHLSQVCAEVEGYLNNGVKEIVLTGIDLGSYQSDGVRLVGLLKQLLSISENQCAPGEYPARFRASSLEPMSITSGFIELLAQNDGRICRHLHLPLQSGSNAVLKEMGRPYTADEYRKLVETLYEQIPELSLSTDIICGFPGETDEDFTQTIELARAARFSKIHVFSYSKREGTPAAERKDQVPAFIIAKRSAELRALAESLRLEDRIRRKGTSELVLVQDKIGLSESYHEIPLPTEAHHGDLIRMVLP